MMRTTIITGAYGSGKTECAMSLAIDDASCNAVTLVDLDFVNPYFRSQDHRAALEQYGVHIVAPEARVAAIDAPSLPAEAHEAIVHPHGHTIVDLGGDPAGAIVIGQFAPEITNYDLWAVVNFSRPTTSTPEQAAILLGEIATATRLRLTGLISNTHLGHYTTPDVVLQGLALAHELGDRLCVPVQLVCVPPPMALPSQAIPILQITPRLLRPWE